MKIHNIRLGHATNSSSSHSIIFDPSIKANDAYDENFGWDYFTLGSSSAKKEYIASTVYASFSGLPFEMTNMILDGLGLPKVTANEYGGIERNVDHESLYLMPIEMGYNTPSLDFISEFRDYLLRDGIYILGGNDNDSNVHTLLTSTNQVTFGNWGTENDGYVCRKDGDWWTLYHNATGNRITLTFNDDAPPYKPLSPLLVDMKLNNNCSHGCAYCYQGSTKNGDDGDKEMIDRMIWRMEQSKVFEVAIGGGEPTESQYFIQTITSLHSRGIRANFTTKSIGWLETEAVANRIIPAIGAFAYSATGIHDLDRIKTIFDYRKYPISKFTVQVVPATLTPHMFKEIMAWCKRNNVRITLLGFKDSGRGEQYRLQGEKKRWDKFDETKWLDLVQELYDGNQCPVLSIDTTLASRYEDQLHDIVPEYMYHVEEGRYSMYMDMVSNMVGPSSYHGDRLKNIDIHGTIEDMFADIEPIEGAM